MPDHHEIYVIARPAVDHRPAAEVVDLLLYLHARPVPMTCAGRPLDETVELTKHWYLLETSRYTPPRAEEWAEWEPRPRLYGPFVDRAVATAVCHDVWRRMQDGTERDAPLPELYVWEVVKWFIGEIERPVGCTRCGYLWTDATGQYDPPCPVCDARRSA